MWTLIFQMESGPAKWRNLIPSSWGTIPKLSIVDLNELPSNLLSSETVRAAISQTEVLAIVLLCILHLCSTFRSGLELDGRSLTPMRRCTVRDNGQCIRNAGRDSTWWWRGRRRAATEQNGIHVSPRVRILDVRETLAFNFHPGVLRGILTSQSQKEERTWRTPEPSSNAWDVDTRFVSKSGSRSP